MSMNALIRWCRVCSVRIWQGNNPFKGSTRLVHTLAGHSIVNVYIFMYCVAILVCISSYYLIYGRNVHMIHSCGSLRVYDYIRIESALAVNTQNALGNMSETQWETLSVVIWVGLCCTCHTHLYCSMFYAFLTWRSRFSQFNVALVYYI